jgi:hypothetical protein
VAKDVFGYALGYYDGDYEPIGTQGAAPFVNPLPGNGTGKFNYPPHANTGLLSGKNLYNGNIRHMMQALNHVNLDGDTTFGLAKKNHK